MNTLILKPAYGRDYKNKAMVLADWQSNKDFIICNFNSPWCGRPVSISSIIDLKASGYSNIELRYSKLTKLIMISL